MKREESHRITVAATLKRVGKQFPRDHTQHSNKRQMRNKRNLKQLQARYNNRVAAAALSFLPIHSYKEIV